MPTALSLKEFGLSPEELAEHRIVMAYFGAPWCGPCRSMSPMIAEVAERHPEDLRVVKINIDEHPDLLAAEGISSVPVIKIYHDGELSHTILGAVRKDELLRQLGLEQ